MLITLLMLCLRLIQLLESELSANTVFIHNKSTFFLINVNTIPNTFIKECKFSFRKYSEGKINKIHVYSLCLL